MNEWLYQYISCRLIFRGFHAIEVEFFQLNLLHLPPCYHYTPAGCHGMPKISHGGFAYISNIRILFNDWKLNFEENTDIKDGTGVSQDGNIVL